MGLIVAPRNPFRMKMAVLAHQAYLGAFAVGAKLLRGINGEHHGLVLGFVRAIFLIAVFDVPFVLDLIVDRTRFSHLEITEEHTGPPRHVPSGLVRWSTGM